MGGGKYPSVLTDPAIEKWYHMKEHTHEFYKLTPRTLKIAGVFCVAIPATLYWFVVKDWTGVFKATGARRGEPLFRSAAPVSSTQESTE